MKVDYPFLTKNFKFLADRSTWLQLYLFSEDALNHIFLMSQITTNMIKVDFTPP